MVRSSLKKLITVLKYVGIYYWFVYLPGWSSISFSGSVIAQAIALYLTKQIWNDGEILAFQISWTIKETYYKNPQKIIGDDGEKFTFN